MSAQMKARQDSLNLQRYLLYKQYENRKDYAHSVNAEYSSSKIASVLVIEIKAQYTTKMRSQSHTGFHFVLFKLDFRFHSTK